MRRFSLLFAVLLLCTGVLTGCKSDPVSSDPDFHPAIVAKRYTEPMGEKHTDDHDTVKSYVDFFNSLTGEKAADDGADTAIYSFKWYYDRDSVMTTFFANGYMYHDGLYYKVSQEALAELDTRFEEMPGDLHPLTNPGF